VHSGALPQSQLDADQSALDSAAAEVASLEAQIARKVVRAPFTGRLGIRAVNLGQYLAPGTQVTVLETIESVYVDFTLPQERLQSLQTGLPVRVTLLGGAALDGTVIAIDPRVDSTTRTIQVRATVPNKDERLRPGMFVSVSVILPERLKVVAVPATAVVHAPYGDSVFIVEDAKDSSGNPLRGPDGAPIGVVRQQFVRLGEARGDFVAILEGLAPSQQVVSAGAFKLRNGTRVTITPDVKPAPELAPHPQNR
jgi:membrane fusion protein (multidrug efflux system)